MVDLKGAHFEKDIILTCGRWYLTYLFNYRQREEFVHERGVAKVSEPFFSIGPLRGLPQPCEFVVPSPSAPGVLAVL